MSELRHEHGVPQAIAERLAAATDFVFDVDNTLVQNQGVIPADLAELIAAVPARSGIATSRCERELTEIVTGTGHHLRGLFSGPIILEDGALAYVPGQDQPKLLVDISLHQPVVSLLSHIERHLQPVDGQPTWQRLDSLAAPLVRVPRDYMASGTIWEQGQENSPDYAKVMAWVRAAASELGVLDRVELLEVGNGTLRISIPGRSKGAALIDLQHDGILDLSRTAYFGDGMNDIPAARAVRAAGGLVIAVDQHCAEFMAQADFVTTRRGPEAIAALLRPLKPASGAGGLDSWTTPANLEL